MSTDSRTNFQKLEPLFAGDSKQTFRGKHLQFGRFVAIAELNANASESVRREFFHEASIWAQFRHHRLAGIEEINEERNWVVSEFLPFSFLDKFNGNCDLQQLRLAVLEILDGLKTLHESGYLHCNLTSNNIRYNNENEGFKLTNGRGLQLSMQTRLPSVRGSNKYRAPEMLDGDFGPIGPSTDLYLLAMVILEGLAGTDSFPTLFGDRITGSPDTETGWFRWHNSEDQLPPIKSLIPKIPSAFGDLLDAMLSKSVLTRMGNADQCLRELSQINPAEFDQAFIDPSQAAPAAQPSQPGPQTSGQQPTAGEASAESISRPSQPVYLRMASGVLAGKIFAFPISEIKIGDSPDCQVQLSSTDYPEIAGRQVRLSLSPASGGWIVTDIRPEDCRSRVTVADRVCGEDQTLKIKSGEILRVSERGPDLQFVVQGSHDWTWQDVSDQLGLSKKQAKRPPAKKSTGPNWNSAPSRPQAGHVPLAPTAPRSHPAPAAPPTPARPATVPTTGSPPPMAQPPAPPQPPMPPAPVAAAIAPTAPTAPAAPSAPSAPLAPSAPNRPPQPSDSGGGFFSDLATNKDKRNWVILAGGLLVALVVIPFVVPQSDSGNDKTPSENNEQVEEEAAAKPTLENQPDNGSEEN